MKIKISLLFFCSFMSIMAIAQDWTQTQNFLTIDGKANDWFGVSVYISGEPYLQQGL